MHILTLMFYAWEYLQNIYFPGKVTELWWKDKITKYRYIYEDEEN